MSVFVVTQEELLKLLGDGAAPLAEALAESKARTSTHPGNAEKIEIKVQGGNVVEIVGAAPRWKCLTR